MPITRKFVAQDQEENQILKMDSATRYIVNSEEAWQFLFGPNSAPSSSAQIVKIAAEFDYNSFDDIRFTAYLYNQANGSVDSAATCTFNVYTVVTPNWQDQFITAIPGTLQSNSYFFTTASLSSLTPADLDGSSTLMIEAVLTRLSDTYRDRIYINHLGIYDSLFRLKQEVEFLDATKLDE
jgi:hypothetical protein